MLRVTGSVMSIQPEGEKAERERVEWKNMVPRHSSHLSPEVGNIPGV